MHNLFFLFMFPGQTAESREIQRQNHHHTPNKWLRIRRD